MYHFCKCCEYGFNFILFTCFNIYGITCLFLLKCHPYIFSVLFTSALTVQSVLITFIL